MFSKYTTKIAGVLVASVMFTATAPALASAASVTRVEQAIVQGEKVETVVKNGEETINGPQTGAASFALKAFIAALRVGGLVLKGYTKFFPSKTADILVKNSTKIANVLESGIAFAENTLTNAFTKIGIPSDAARSIAKFIMALI